ncbi:MAG: helix-turn-helix domain-containing protein [Ruminococcaceae bacterium]|nr:helix-turn-helix domain-containing protein [Oscillospiraceae bacterium]
MMGRIQQFERRQSMKNKQFEVFHYRERSPGNMEVHHHEFFEIYFLLGGEVSFRVEGRSYTLKPGDMLLINPQELHQALVDRDTIYERMVLWIDRGYLGELSAGGMDLASCFDTRLPTHTNRLHPNKTQRAELQVLLEKLAGEFYGEELGNSQYAQGLLMQFLVEVNRLARNSDKQPVSAEETDLVDQVLSYIGTHFTEDISLEMLANIFYVSKYHLSHEFSKRVGTGIYRYIMFRRLMHSRELLEGGIPPGEVYQQCGFGDYANFYRSFKSFYGVSPREYARGDRGEQV